MSVVERKDAPQWTTRKDCKGCNKAFNLLNRDHHCRNCGQMFCGMCSAKSIPLVGDSSVPRSLNMRWQPHYGFVEAVRVCDSCYQEVFTAIKDNAMRKRIVLRPGAGPAAVGKYNLNAPEGSEGEKPP
jgi:hepatocyte growth factor-regulated tyrosine kinase substrate